MLQALRATSEWGGNPDGATFFLFLIKRSFTILGTKAEIINFGPVILASAVWILV